jgi:SM-20-related protein
MNNELLQNQEEAQFEQLIQGLITQQFGHDPLFLSPNDTENLRANLKRYQADGSMKPAGIGRKFDYQQNLSVRGDSIRWIEPESSDPFEQALMGKIARLVQYLNRTCYTSINAYEFHYASYAPNSFYKRHLDQFVSDRGRKYSLVIYLNEDWKEEDGGQLSLYPEGKTASRILPLGGSVVFFKSDEMEHEVHPSFNRERMSIAGWLKSI